MAKIQEMVLAYWMEWTGAAFVLFLLLFLSWRALTRRTPAPIAPILEELPDVAAQHALLADPEEAPPSFDDVLSLTLLANPGEPFGGIALLQTLLTYGLRFGQFDIFHYYELDTRQFSVASAVKPGTFDIDDMPQFSTQGLTFFMSLNDDTHLETNFEKMLQSAQKIAKELGGYLVNDQKEALTDSKIQDYRRIIRQHVMQLRGEDTYAHTQ